MNDVDPTKCEACGGNFGGLYAFLLRGKIHVFCYQHLPWKDLGYDGIQADCPQAIKRCRVGCAPARTTKQDDSLTEDQFKMIRELVKKLKGNADEKTILEALSKAKTKEEKKSKRRLVKI